MIQKKGIRAIYNHQTLFYAIEDFIGKLPNQYHDFNSEVKNFVYSLYRKTLPNKKIKYFIDKTPRYYLIIPFLAEVFPTAKFIFLFRNPLAVLSSILTTWANDCLITFPHDIDLYQGPHLLSQGYTMLKDRSVAINYSDLVKSPESELRRICSFLKIRFDKDMVLNFKDIKLAGRMGDQIGINDFDSISTTSLDKWKAVLNTRYRKFYSKRYIEQIGDETLRCFGTSVKELSSEIDSITTLRSGSLQDFFYHAMSIYKHIFPTIPFRRIIKTNLKIETIVPYI